AAQVFRRRRPEGIVTSTDPTTYFGTYGTDRPLWERWSAAAHGGTREGLEDQSRTSSRDGQDARPPLGTIPYEGAFGGRSSSPPASVSEDPTMSRERSLGGGLEDG